MKKEILVPEIKGAVKEAVKGSSWIVKAIISAVMDKLVEALIIALENKFHITIRKPDPEKPEE